MAVESKSNETSAEKNVKSEAINGAEFSKTNGDGETVESLKQHKEDLNTGKKSASQVDDVKDSGDEEKENTKDKENEPRDEQDLVFVQDVGFTVKINAPGVEQFDIQVSSMEMVQEIHQLLMDREDTCHRTCFSLQLNGVSLDNFAELKNIDGLKEGSVIKVVEEPYTMREARIHLRHVRDLLKSLDPSDAYNGLDCSSLSFLNVITQGDILEKKKTRPEVWTVPHLISSYQDHQIDHCYHFSHRVKNKRDPVVSKFLPLLDGIHHLATASCTGI